jgi:hypothetical protein
MIHFINNEKDGVIMKNVIATNGEEIMSLEEFLMWEMNGGQGTYESDLGVDEPEWNELSMVDKIVYMANSIIGDMVSYGWELK